MINARLSEFRPYLAHFTSFTVKYTFHSLTVFNLNFYRVRVSVGDWLCVCLCECVFAHVYVCASIKTLHEVFYFLSVKWKQANPNLFLIITPLSPLRDVSFSDTLLRTEQELSPDPQEHH